MANKYFHYLHVFFWHNIKVESDLAESKVKECFPIGQLWRWSSNTSTITTMRSRIKGLLLRLLESRNMKLN